MTPPLDNPLLEDLGVCIVAWREDFCELALPLQPRHLNRRGRVQGGVVATLLDAACGYAGLLSSTSSEVAEGATITLTVNYLAKLTTGTVRAVGRRTGGGRNIYFASGELYAADGTLAATAQGSFRKANRPEAAC